MSHPKFLNKLFNLVHIYIVCHIKAGWLFVWNVIFYRIFITPLYMFATQTTLNRLKQPKDIYSAPCWIRRIWYIPLNNCATKSSKLDGSLIRFTANNHTRAACTVDRENLTLPKKNNSRGENKRARKSHPPPEVNVQSTTTASNTRFTQNARNALPVGARPYCNRQPLKKNSWIERNRENLTPRNFPIYSIYTYGQSEACSCTLQIL